MAMLYVSRIPTLLQHAVLAARVMMSVLSAESQRAAMLGYVGLAYGVGVVVGPALGGQASRLSVFAPSWLAAAGSVLSFVLIAVYLPRAFHDCTELRDTHFFIVRTKPGCTGAFVVCTKPRFTCTLIICTKPVYTCTLCLYAPNQG